jgi:hypothetical protein
MPDTFSKQIVSFRNLDNVIALLFDANKHIILRRTKYISSETLSEIQKQSFNSEQEAFFQNPEGTLS